MSLSLRYICSQCKRAFRYDNQCRCKMCGFIDAQICLSCHNNTHNLGLYFMSVTLTLAWILRGVS